MSGDRNATSNDVYVQDQNSEIVSYVAVQPVGGPKTLGEDTVIGSYTITMSPGHGFNIGDELFIFYANAALYAKVINVATDVLTLDTIIDRTCLASSSIVFKVTSNMNVNGAVTPQVFSLATGTSSTAQLDITGLRISIIDNTAMDDGTFGGIAALTKGIIFRVRRANGQQEVIWNAKTNGELGLFIDNMQYSSKAPSGAYGVSFEWKIREAHGVTIRLNPGDYIDIIVQDDLTNLTSFKTYIYGHFVV